MNKEIEINYEMVEKELWIYNQCYCGSTYGCPDCNPYYFGFTYNLKDSLWGLVKDAKIEEKDIKKAKKSLFPKCERGDWELTAEEERLLSKSLYKSKTEEQF